MASYIVCAMSPSLYLYDRQSQDFTAHTYAFELRRKDNSETEHGYQNARMGNKENSRIHSEILRGKKNPLKCKSPYRNKKPNAPAS